MVPKAIRLAVDVKDKFGEDIEPKPASYCDTKGETCIMPNVTRMIEKFKVIAKKYLRIEPKNEFEWMFLAQHYGLPTKLLDWSTDPLVALFFSMPKSIDYIEISGDDDNEEIDEDFYEFSDSSCAVFAMNPCEINKILLGKRVPDGYECLPFNINDDYNYLRNYLENKELVQCCIDGLPIDKRICRQSGNFTIQGYITWPLDFIDAVREKLYKIIIPYNIVAEITE